MKKIRTVAIYLPQFHPIEINDMAWGKGFTEWTNVTKAKPRFPGHYQPRLPKDLGYCDLRVPETREEQANYAKKYGIDAFCFYHYWFNGKRIMNLPLDKWFETGKPDIPLMLCWANENWSRGWNGHPQDLLIKEDYSKEDDINHIRFLLKIFKDPRYLKIDGRPVFAVYNSLLHPHMKECIDVWREEARKEGLELYLIRFETYNNTGASFLEAGFDAAAEFQPHCNYGYRKFYSQIMVHLNGITYSLFKKRWCSTIYNYDKFYKHVLRYFDQSYKRYPCATPCWDNSPRHHPFFALHKSTPKKFGRWMTELYSKFQPYSSEENLIFINAWNEWAEGNYLEPDMKWGSQYLEEHLKAKQVIKG